MITGGVRVILKCFYTATGFMLSESTMTRLYNRNLYYTSTQVHP